MAFSSREIEEPYGLILGLTALDGWLYGDDPLTYIETAGIYDALRRKVDGSCFADLLAELLGDGAKLCRVYLLPSETKARRQAAEPGPAWKPTLPTGTLPPGRRLWGI